MKGKAAKPRKSMKEQVNSDETMEVQEGEQLDLIDVAPENSKDIIKHAKLYESAKRRKEYESDTMKAEEEMLIELIKESGLQPVDGKIVFSCSGFKFTVTTKDGIKVKEYSVDSDNIQSELNDDNY